MSSGHDQNISGGGSERTCSFCSRPETAVAFLVAGPHANICDDCVQVSVWLIREQGPWAGLFRIAESWAKDGDYSLLRVFFPAATFSWLAAQGIASALGTSSGFAGILLILGIGFVFGLHALYWLMTRRGKGDGKAGMGLVWASAGIALGRSLGWQGALAGGVISLVAWMTVARLRKDVIPATAELSVTRSQQP